MIRILKSELDKFYTKIDVAKELLKKTNYKQFDVIIEPSCGNGSFYNQIDHNNKIGVDIEPEIDNVITQDFLTYQIKSEIKNILVVGNPPFGKQGSLALKFIKKSAEFSNVIAFILPLSFMKDSMKNKIPEYFHLKYEEKLNENSFLLNGVDYDVKCCFQIWEKKEFKRKKVKPIKAIDFTYTKDKSIADLAIRRVGVYAGKGFIDTLNKSEQSHYFIILNDKSKTNFIIESLKVKKWDDLTVGPRSISKSELNIFLNSII
jgi:predicted RNA methylase